MLSLCFLGLLAIASGVKGLGSSCSGPLGSGSAATGDPYWMQTITRRGTSAFNPNASYAVYRNVKDYGAKGDGHTDDTAAINLAISDGSRCGNVTCQSSTLTPALVFFPSGTYRVTAPILSYYYTSLVGDFNDRPTLLADAAFNGIAVIDTDYYIPGANGAEWYVPVNNFFRSVRNFIIDTTQMPASAFGTGLHWQVGQATSLINVHVEMSTASGNKHQGIYMENGSGGFMADLSFNGGAFGMWISNQQFTIHNVVITNADTGIYQLWNWGFTFKNIQISGCRVGFGLSTGGLTLQTQTAGSVVILDSAISASTAAVQTTSDQSASLGGSIVLQNVDLSGSSVGVVDGAGHTFLAGGGTVNQFVLGDVYSGTGTTKTYSTSAKDGLPLPSALLDSSSSNNGVFFRTRPQYGSYSPNDFVSVKANGAVCNGNNDDTSAIQNVINNFWGCKIIYIDAGACKVTDTLTIPTGTIVVGEFWSTILASGSKFSDASNPQPVLKVGNPGDSGNVEISDIVISPTAGSAGAVAIEWNVQGAAGQVGMWDVHVRIGGAIGTGIQVSECPAGGSTSSTTCQGAFLGLHVTSTGSGYFENVWVWSADHDIDDPGQGRIDCFSARGIFIDHSIGPIWLVGTSSEHHTFYQYSIVGAQNIYAGMIQTETPYYQPVPEPPAPFQSSSSWNDPSWSNSGSAWALTIANSSSIYVYGAGLYSFFQDFTQTCQNNFTCQNSMALVDTDSVATFIYSLSTIGAPYMLTVGSANVIAQGDNTDGFQSTFSKWSSSNTNPEPPTSTATPVGCSSIQTAALAAMTTLMDPASGYFYNRDCERTGICGHFPEPGTDSPGLSAQEWTNVNAFETVYNTLWQTGSTTYADLAEEQAIVPNLDHGDDNVLPVTGSFTSQDDAAWAGLFYIKVQQYYDAHGLGSGSTYYYNQALSIQQGIAGTWLSSSGCGGGIPQQTSGTGPNTITTHLFFSLTVVLAQYSDPDGSLRKWADTVANWYRTGNGQTLRDSDGLWFDGQNSSCTGPDHTKWTYNQGPILSGMGAYATLTGDQSWIDFALTTLNGVVNAPGNIPLPQPTSGPNNILEIVNGNLAEWCDGASSSSCNHDQQYFKGAFMKHLQYFLDNVNNTIRDKYTGFVGEQASAVIHFGTNSGGFIGSVWYAPDQGGSIFNYKTQAAGLDALNCAQKYATC